MQKEIIICRVKDEFGCFLCMSAHPVVYNGISFRTAEALFQWRRFSNYPDVQKEILEQKSPMGAKMKARKHRDLLNRGKDWDQSIDDISWMKECLYLKINQHPDIRKKLIDTGNKTIIEDSTPHNRESARFWGAVYKDGQWIGENHLGKLWMEIRNELIT